MRYDVPHNCATLEYQYPVIVLRDADLTENYKYISMKFRTGVHVFCWEVGVFSLAIVIPLVVTLSGRDTLLVVRDYTLLSNLVQSTYMCSSKTLVFVTDYHIKVKFCIMIKYAQGFYVHWAWQSELQGSLCLTSVNQVTLNYQSYHRWHDYVSYTLQYFVANVCTCTNNM